jgi:hypothetical protein
MITARDVLPELYAGCEGVVELRALPSGRQCFTGANDNATRATFVKRNPRQEIYWGVASRRSDANGTEANCQHLGSLYADLDFKIASEAEARERLLQIPHPPNCGEPKVDRGGRIPTLFEVNPVPEYDGAVEGEAGLRTVPVDELANRVVVGLLAAGGRQAVQHGRLGLFQVGKGQYSLGRLLLA